MTPRHLRQLRSMDFSEVVIPQMSASQVLHLNLYWLVAALRFERVVILPGDGDPKLRERRTFRRALPWLALKRLVAVIDVPLLLGLLLVARLVPRRRRRNTAGKSRVLHIISSFGLGGAQRQLAEVVNHTPADRYDVDVLAFCGSAREFSRDWLTRDDVNVTFIEHGWWMSYATVAIAKRCRAKRYDVVHTWLCLTNAIGGAGARLAGVPCVVTAVRSLSLWKRTWYWRWWYRPVDIIGARLATAVTVNARALVKDFASWTWIEHRRIHVVHNGLDPSRFLVDRQDSRAALLRSTGVSDASVVVGSVGRLAHEKDHRLFLRVLAEARRAHPNIHGVVIGDGLLRAELEAYAASLGLAGSVSFLGERKDVIRLMAGLDAFVLPSIIEGFPNALLEAVFLGIPSIATNVGGCPDVLGEEGSTFDVGDEAAALRALLAVIDDTAAASAVAERARRRALDMFTATHTTNTWLNLYERCLTEAFQR